MSKQTKIVATIGPASDSEETLEQMIAAGMNIARFNTKHSEPDWHDERVQRVRKVADKLGKSVGVLLDLQGPEIRINLPNQESFKVEKDGKVFITSDEDFDRKHFVIVPQMVIDSLNVNDSILFEDGACELVVSEKQGNFIEARALMDCTVSHRKTMNTPGVVLDMPSLTTRDHKYLDEVKHDHIDYVGLSFVRNVNDILALRSELEKRKIRAHVVAKIENQEALNNIDEIIEEADAIMIARGDLGVEVPFEELTYWQKSIIAKCREKAKPVITATEMLKSMVNNPRPSRAEVSDVANAIYDGTDAVMLSEETTIGKYPVKAVQTQAKIAEFNEGKTNHVVGEVVSKPKNLSSAVSHAAVSILDNDNYKIDKIICLTETGLTARLISRFRPKVPVYAVTSSGRTNRRLALSFGVYPQMIVLPEKKVDYDQVMEKCKSRGIVKIGDVILFIHGNYWKHPGLTNTVKVITIE